MMHKLVALFAATLFSTAVLAQQEPMRGEEKPKMGSETEFKSLDRDQDQRLSQSEVASDPQLAQHFVSLDKNSDGYLSKREYSGYSHMEKKQNY